MDDMTVKLTELHYKGKWILRTTETGIEVNGKVEWYRIAWAYTKYIWYKVRDAIMNGDNGPTSQLP